MSEDIKRIIVSDSNQLAGKGAEMFCEIAKKSISDRGRFVVAASGGTTPRAMHARLSHEPYLSDDFWQNTHIFWVDERMVDFDHPESNFGTARKDLLEKIPIPLDQIYPMPVATQPKEAAGLYQRTLETFFQSIGSDEPVFDLIFLGIGTDGHTASLFPGQVLMHQDRSWVINVKSGTPNVDRLSLTYQVLNRARNVLFMVSGTGKALIVQKLLEDNSVDLPAKNIRPLSGTLIWLMDRKAASLLSD